MTTTTNLELGSHSTDVCVARGLMAHLAVCLSYSMHYTPMAPDWMRALPLLERYLSSYANSSTYKIHSVLPSCSHYGTVCHRDFNIDNAEICLALLLIKSPFYFSLSLFSECVAQRIHDWVVHADRNMVGFLFYYPPPAVHIS